MRLIAQLNAVGRGNYEELRKEMNKPSASEQDRFLAQYNFGPDSVVERVEITKNEVFEFYMFAIWNKLDDEVRILVLWPKNNAPESQWT